MKHKVKDLLEESHQVAENDAARRLSTQGDVEGLDSVEQVSMLREASSLLADGKPLHSGHLTAIANAAQTIEALRREKAEAVSLAGLTCVGFETDSVTGQEFAVYADSDGRRRIKLCGRNQQELTKVKP